VIARTPPPFPQEPAVRREAMGHDRSQARHAERVVARLTAFCGHSDGSRAAVPRAGKIGTGGRIAAA
jgi:hypothetical protein